MMGTGVGLTVGFIFGSYSIMRQGAGPRGFVGTLSQYMLSSAATLGFFLAIGSVIRSDSGQIQYHPSLMQQSQKMALASPVLRQEVYRASRAEAFQRMKRRWDAEKQREAESPRF
ncbi:subunit of TIM23 translocase complex [Serendipita sp. 411]|nr:subunit of TIM23 translocase complex [Serendipita sp. 411]